MDMTPFLADLAEVPDIQGSTSAVEERLGGRLG